MAAIRSFNSFVLRAPRRTTIWLGVIIALLFLLGTASAVSAARGYVTIINLTGKTIYVATAQFVPGVNDSGLAFVPKDYMRFNGWYAIEAGKGRDLPNGSFFVKDSSGNRISWSNKKEWTGLVRNGSAFNNVLVDSGYYGKFDSYFANLDKFVTANPVYTKATYQALDVGRYTVTGSNASTQAYRVLSKTFSFDFRSRDFKMLKDCYPVQGTPVDYALAGEQRKHGPSETWTMYSDRVCVSVIVKGFQPNAFAAREQGYYVGQVTVYYTTRY